MGDGGALVLDVAWDKVGYHGSIWASKGITPFTLGLPRISAAGQWFPPGAGASIAHRIGHDSGFAKSRRNSLFVLVDASGDKPGDDPMTTSPGRSNAAGPGCGWIKQAVNARRPVSRVLFALWARDDHSSGTRIAARLTRPTRATGRKCPRVTVSGSLLIRPPAAPIRSCSRWGLPCRPCHQGRGALLPHRFTLACSGCPMPAVCFLWHCPWGRPRRPLAGTVFPWSPDFPPSQPPGEPKGINSGRPAVWPAGDAPEDRRGQRTHAQGASRPATRTGTER